MRYLLLLAMFAGCDSFTNEHLESCLNACERAYEHNVLTSHDSPTIVADDEACRTLCTKGQ